ncbi:Hypothetical predicted protein [Lynx pardinus]|uniref:Uncharacterized protein n=1 Tax=Lynx pardinus TaxID=191816 RepID=A0A485MIE0_LYNPA|nr:Hypothetical predicted protein [Lynx pardinus]
MRTHLVRHNTLVKLPALDFGSGHNLTVLEFEPRFGLYAVGVEPAWDCVSLFLCPSPACSLSLSQNK